MRPLSRTRLLPAVLALLVLPSSAALLVRGFENGSFDQGLGGWQVRRGTSAHGAAQASARVTVGEEFALGGDDAMAGLWLGASAGSLAADMPPSSAVALARLEQEIPDIRSTLLAFDWTSRFGGMQIAAAAMTYRARLLVERLSGTALVHEVELLAENAPCSDPCPGIAFRGATPYAHVELDLADHGFQVGDDIRVRIEFRAHAWSRRGSNLATFDGVLLVDRFFLYPNRLRRL